jgi:hypothetical protein
MRTGAESKERAEMDEASAFCADCERLSAEYESATLRWFRLDSQMRIADYGRDRDASARIACELAAVNERRETLKRALRNHMRQHHGSPIGAAA